MANVTITLEEMSADELREYAMRLEAAFDDVLSSLNLDVDITSIRSLVVKQEIDTVEEGSNVTGLVINSR